MSIDTSKLLFLKGSTAARAPKVGMPEPVVRPDPSKLLALKGYDAARSAKIGVITEPDLAT